MTTNRNLLTLTPEERRELERGPNRAPFRQLMHSGQGSSSLCPRAGAIAKSRPAWAPVLPLSRLGEADLNEITWRVWRGHQGSQPRIAIAAVQARVGRRVQQKPSEGSELGLSKSTVHPHPSAAESSSFGTLYAQPQSRFRKQTGRHNAPTILLGLTR